MAQKNLDAYKLGVVLDASGAAKGISALKEADKAASLADSSLDKLGQSAKKNFGDLKRAAEDNSRKTQQALASALLAGKKNVGGLVSEAKRAQAEFKALEKAEEKALRLASGGFLSRSMARAESLLPGLSQISNVIQALPQIGGLAHSLISPLTEAAEQGIRFNMLIESAESGFKGVLGGAEQAKKYVKELTDFAAANPIFNTQGTIRAARLMNVFGLEVKKTTFYMKTWGSVMATGGFFNDENLEGVATAFGQMRAKGTVSAEEMQQLAERGIPAWEALAKAIGKTEAETRKLAESGKLKGSEAVDAITAVLASDPRYAKGADEFGKTLEGRLAQLQDLREAAAGRAMTRTTKELADTLDTAMTGDAPAVVANMASAMDAALAPVAKLIGASARGLLGGGLTSGMAEGIRDTLPIVYDAVTEMGLGALFTLKGVLGIHSPSLAFRLLGQNSGNSYALGLRETLKKLSKEHGGDLRKYLEELAKDPRVKAWFETIRQVEGGRPDIMAGGRRVKSGPRHPGEIVPRDEWYQGPKGPSSAAGNWQITLTNWRKWAPILGLDNFSDPNQQMMVALALFVEKGGDVSLLNGDLKGALKASAPWAATPLSHLPGAKPLGPDKFVERYKNLLGGGSAGAVPVSVVNWSGGAEEFVKRNVFSPEMGEVVSMAMSAADWADYDREHPDEQFSKRNVYSPEMGGVSSVAMSAEDWAEYDKAHAAEYKSQINGIFASVMAADVMLKNMTASAEQVVAGDAVLATSLMTLPASFRAAGEKMDAAAEDWAKKVIVSGESVSKRLGAAFNQLGAFLPQQQVGRKRSLFGKILGAAAPFLSFIPGIGPILSAGASIASAGLQGNWSDAFAQGVGALQPGGAFRGSGSSGGSGSGGGLGSAAGSAFDGYRAAGGPVRRGRAYVVGEHRAEVFEPGEDGYVYPSVDSYEHGRGGVSFGRHGDKGIGTLLTRIEEHFARVSSVPMDHVFTYGAKRNPGAVTEAFMSHGARDPKVIEWMNRRIAA